MFKKFTENIKERMEDAKLHYSIGLNQAFDNFSSQINGLFVDKEFFDDEFFEEFEDKLVELDIMPIIAIMLREQLEKKIYNTRVNKNDFKKAIKEVIIQLTNIEKDNELILNKEDLNVLLVIGVNGVGKTTSISKLMHKYKNDYNMEVVAADTFRAGAIEQLNEWAQREEVPITKTKQGHSPSAVVYEGVVSAVENNRNLLICDTAGRLHNKDELMAELKKIHSVISKYPKMNENLSKDYNVKTIIVLDGTAGKNTIEQIKKFNEVTEVDGVIVTKMDANSKVGMIINIAYEVKKPIYFLTSGEDVKSIEKFDYRTYIEMLLGE